MFLINRIIIMTVCGIGILLMPQTAYALRYDLCKAPNQSMACAVAFEKLRSIKNPLNKKKFFDDGVHIKGNKLVKMPTYYIAEPDLDKDGVTELIIALMDEDQEIFCKSAISCPHFIIQNRNPDLKKPKLRFFYTLLGLYANSVALSKDENINNYQSLVIYKSNTTSEFNTYQYDSKSDKYFDLGKNKGGGL